MLCEVIISIIAIFLSPIIAVVIGEILRKRNFTKQKRLEILGDLMGYRDRPSSEAFLRALNSLKLFYYEDGVLKSLVDQLHAEFLKRDEGLTIPEASDDLIIKIIKHICILEGFKNLRDEDVKNLFKVKKN